MAPPLMYLSIIFAFCIIHNCMGAACPSKVCKTADCQNTAEKMRGKMNLKQNPCDDFYEYACGTFIKTAQVPPELSYTGGVFELHRRNLDFKKKLMESPILHTPTCEQSYERKMKKLYSMCMDTNSIDRVKYKDYEDGNYKPLWPTMNPNWTENDFDLQKLHENYHKQFTEVFFHLYLTPNHRGKVSTYQLEIENPDFLIGSGNWVHNLTSDIMRFENYYVELVKELGGDENIAKTDAKAVANMITELSPSFPFGQNRYLPGPRYNPTTVCDMNKNYPFLDWLGIFKKQFSSLPDIEIEGTQPINIPSVKYMQGLGKILTNPANKRSISNLFGLINADKFVSDASPVMRNISMTFIPERNVSRHVRCIELVDNLYSDGMAKLMSRSVMTAINLTNDVKKIVVEKYIALFEKQTWLSAPSKKKIIRKIEKADIKAGGRIKKSDESDLDNYFKRLKIEESFVTTIIQNEIQLKITKLEDVNRPLNVDRWETQMSSYTPIYDPNTNSILFPAGVFLPPVFDQTAPGYLNFASLAYHIAAILGLEFGPVGMSFDENGRYDPWMSNTSAAELEKRGKCFDRQFSKFIDKQVNMSVDGSLHTIITMTDNQGLHFAYQAFKSYSKTQQNQPLLDMNLTLDQLFFVKVLQTWCIKPKDNIARRMLKYGPYVTSGPRVNGMVQNMKEFATAFNCPAHSKMNPCKKCGVWDY